MFTLLSPLTIFVIYLLIVNLLAFIMYWRDKNLAIQGKWRIPENELMLVAAFGGSIGALISMYTFRHKTRHAKFVLGVPIILAMQLMCLLAFFVYVS